MCGAITSEKERESMGLLLLTELRPRHILLQKYLGRLIPMFTMILISLPLTAVAYSLGGITTDYLYTGVYLTVLACLQVGAMSLMFSSYCSSTVSAFVSTYLFGAFFYWMSIFFVRLAVQADIFGYAAYREHAFFLFPPFVFDTVQRAGFHIAAARSVPIILSVVFFLLIARLYLVRRAFRRTQNTMLAVWKRIDGIMDWANQYAWGVTLVHDRHSLPDDRPVAWREVNKKSLGKIRYLFRVLVLTEVPVLLLTLFFLMDGVSSRGESDAFTVLAFAIWILAALTITVQSANVVPAERIRGTLDVLLTTELGGHEIIEQKMAGVRRLILVYLVPFTTLFLLEAWWEAGRWSHRELPTILYLLLSFLNVGIFLSEFSWLSLWIGMKSRTRFRAIMTALIVIVCIIVLPVVPVMLFELMGLYKWDDLVKVLVALSPGVVVFGTELPRHIRIPSVWVAWSLLMHVGALFYFRWRCLTRADRYLGRTASDTRAPFSRLLMTTSLMSAFWMGSYAFSTWLDWNTRWGYRRRHFAAYDGSWDPVYIVLLAGILSGIELWRATRPGRSHRWPLREIFMVSVVTLTIILVVPFMNDTWHKLGSSGRVVFLTWKWLVTHFWTIGGTWCATTAAILLFHFRARKKESAQKETPERGRLLGAMTRGMRRKS
jgi:hypothetical protein